MLERMEIRIGHISIATVLDLLPACLAEGHSVAVWVKSRYADAERIVLGPCLHELDAARSQHLEVLLQFIRLND